MKKVVIALFLVAFMVSPAFALFTNGGFEDGTFNGWTLTGSGAPLSTVMNAATPGQPGQTLDVNPYNGQYMARLQDYSGLFHSTTLSQTATVTQDDLNSGGSLYVNWGAMLVDPDSHVGQVPPNFQIDVYKNGAIATSFYADASNRQGTGWAYAGSTSWSGGGYAGTGPIYYKHDTWAYDFSSFAVGDTMTISLTVNDCGYGGHGGWAFLDGIGTTYQSVPEPASLLFVGLSLLGLAGLKRRFQK